MKKWACIWLAVVMLVSAVSANAANKAKKGGVVGNSYGSQMEQLSDTVMRVTTRKKVSGTLDEINTPGTTVYKAFSAVSDAAVLRAAVEASALGYKALKVSGTRNLSQTLDKRMSASMSPGGISESDFTFANGTYQTNVELAIEVTFNLLSEMPTGDAKGYINVEQTLAQFGLSK